MYMFKGDNFNQCIQNALDAGMVGIPAYCLRSSKGWCMGWFK